MIARMTPASTSSPRAIAWVDGRVLPASEATIPLTDEGFLRGDAVFDAMLVRDGRTHARDLHLARLRASAKAMGIRVPVVTVAVRDLLAAWGGRDGALKIIVTRGGRVRGLLTPASWPETISLETVEMPWRTALTGVKTLSYAANQWALRQARDAHADDALIVEDGQVCELPSGALLLVHGERVSTPDPATAPILDSITVREVARIVEVERRPLTLEDIATADEAFVVSATRPILPVHAIGEHELPAPGPVTARLRDLFDTHIGATLDPSP